MKFFKTLRGILLSLLLLVCVASLCACSPVNLQTKYYDNGAIESTLTLPTGQMKSLGAEVYLIRVNKAYDIVSHYINDLKTAYEDKLIELFSQVYPFSGTMSRAEKLSYISLNNPTFAFEVTVTPSDVSSYDLSSDDATITVTSKFASIYAYIMYFYPDAFKYNEQDNNLVIDKDKTSLLADVPVSNSTLETQEGLFVKTYCQTATPFGYNGGEHVLLSPLVMGMKVYNAGERVLDVARDALSLGSEEVRLLFTFLSPYNRLASNGAISYKDGYICHSWDMDDTTQEVKFYRHIANYVTWYAVALILGVVLIVSGLVTAYIINNHKKKKGMQYMQKIADFVGEKKQTSEEEDG